MIYHTSGHSTELIRGVENLLKMISQMGKLIEQLKSNRTNHKLSEWKIEPNNGKA